MTQTVLQLSSRTARASGRTSATKHRVAWCIPRAIPNAYSVGQLAKKADADEVETHALEHEPVQWKLQGCGSHASAPLLQNHEHVTVTHGCYVLHGPAHVVKVGPGLLRAELQPGSWVEIMGAPQSPMSVLLPEVMTYGERKQSDKNDPNEDDQTISGPTNGMPTTRPAYQHQNAPAATHQLPSASCEQVHSATTRTGFVGSASAPDAPHTISRHSPTVCINSVRQTPSDLLGPAQSNHRSSSALADPVHKASVQPSHQTDTDCPSGHPARPPDQQSHQADTEPSTGNQATQPERPSYSEHLVGHQATRPEHRNDLRLTTGHQATRPGHQTGPVCQSGHQATGPDHRSHPEHPAAALKLRTRYCLLAAEHLELRGTFALSSYDGSFSGSFTSMDLPSAVQATAAPGACSGTSNLIDGYLLKGKPAAGATAAPKPTAGGVVMVAPATEDCGMWEGQVATASEGEATDGLVPAPGAALAAADRILQAAAGIGASPCGSYSDSSPASCPGVMHHKGRVLISVHALPQDGGFCIDLGTDSVMSHPLNCCCGDE